MYAGSTLIPITSNGVGPAVLRAVNTSVPIYILYILHRALFAGRQVQQTHLGQRDVGRYIIINALCRAES